MILKMEDNGKEWLFDGIERLVIEGPFTLESESGLKNDDDIVICGLSNKVGKGDQRYYAFDCRKGDKSEFRALSFSDAYVMNDRGDTLSIHRP